MDITAKKSDLLDGLLLTSSVADKKAIMPILGTVKLTAGKGSLVCSATDLRISTQAEIPAKVAKQGSICLDAKKLQEIVKSASAEEISIALQTQNRVVIKSGKSKYTLLGLPASDFPAHKDPKEELTAIDGASLLDMIRRTLFSVSADENHRLNGICLWWDGKILQAASTDGHRLSKITYAEGEGQAFMIPRKGLLEIKRLLKANTLCAIGFEEGLLYIKARGHLLAIQLLDSQFPPIEQVIPTKNTLSVSLPRTGFAEILKRVSIIGESYEGAQLVFRPGALVVEKANVDVGEAVEELEIEYSRTEQTYGVNVRYLLEQLDAMDGEVVGLEGNGPLDPILLRQSEGDYLGVVMPMRL